MELRTDLMRFATRQPGYPNPDQIKQKPQKPGGPQTEVGPKVQADPETTTTTRRAPQRWKSGVLSQVQVRLHPGGGRRWPETPHLAAAPCSFKIKIKAKQSERIPMIPRVHTQV